ncbi:Carboxy-terminal processing protease CtpB [bacterium HR29]|jgi:carboxyl-terminal processing protease|nr:Carboxy-terminal processing protease CtpB [bacterium HR29]
MDTAQAPQLPFAARFARVAVPFFLLLAIVALAFGLGYLVHDLRTGDTVSAPAAAPATSQSDPVGAALLDEIYEVLRQNHVDGDLLTPESVRQAAIDGILRLLNDPHTSYVSPADIAAGALDLGSTYQGIGASVTDRNGVIEIVAPFRDSPAERAGIRPGDIILAVDGEPTDGWTSVQAVQKIRGPAGTEVTLTVKHTDGTVEEITIVRGDILIESVFTEPPLEVIPGESGTKLVDRNGNEVSDIAYVHISQFHDRTLTELRQKLADVERKGYRGLIIDLRANPGGLLGATVQVTDEFLDSGIILTEVDAEGRRQTWDATPGGLATTIPLVIIVDSSSASGAEVMAAALQDHGRAKVVGTRSFGKGTVNQAIELSKCGLPEGCGALYVTVGRWLRPSGKDIEGLGVTPDVEVPMTQDDYVNQGDIQLFAAIDLLRGR